jgi:hypothetical protein
MTIEADIVVETPQRRVLLVECKWIKEPSAKKATDLRDNFAQLSTEQADFFMLALRTGLHIWRRETPSGRPPDFTASTKQIWREYLGKMAERPDAIRSEAMEFAVASWLNDLANDVRAPNSTSEADQVLLQSGVYQRIKNGVVRTHVRA